MTKDEKDKVKAQLRKQIEAQLLEGIENKVERAFEKWEAAEADRIKNAVDAVLKNGPRKARTATGKGCAVCHYVGGKARGKWAKPHSQEAHKDAVEDKG